MGAPHRVRASRQIALVSAQRRPLYAARLAFQTNASDAAAQAAASPEAEHDAGYIVDRAYWLRANAREGDARAYLAQPRRWMRRRSMRPRI